MRSWTKVSIKLVEILGQHLQTPEYLKCCGIESNDAPTRNRTTPNQLQCNQPEPSYLTAKTSTNLPACLGDKRIFESEQALLFHREVAPAVAGSYRGVDERI